MSVRSSDFDDGSLISYGELESDSRVTIPDTSDRLVNTKMKANKTEYDEEKYTHPIESVAGDASSNSFIAPIPAVGSQSEKKTLHADHAPEQMTVLRALDEVTLLDKRIAKKTSELQPIRTLARRTRGALNEQQFAAKCKSDWQALTDLIKRRQLIKGALIRSNTQVQVTVGGQTMTVAEVVERRNALAIHQTLLTHMRSIREAVHRETDKANMVERAEILKIDLESQPARFGESWLPEYLCNWIQQMKDKMKQAVIGRYALDPIKVDERIKTLQTYVDCMDKEARFILAEVNARTIVTIAPPQLLPGVKGGKGKGKRGANSNHPTVLSPDPIASDDDAPFDFSDQSAVDPLQMSILRALTEITQLDLRIAQKTKALVPMRSVSKKAFQGNVDLFIEKCREDWATLDDLLARRQAIKQAMLASNSEVSVVVSGERLTVAEVVERKKSIGALQAILTQLRSQQAKHTQELTKLNTSLESELSKLLEIHLGGKASAPGGGASGKNAGADLEAISSQFHENNAPKILDPLGIESTIKELEDQIEQLEREAKFALSEVNARTKIDITDALTAAAAARSAI